MRLLEVQAAFSRLQRHDLSSRAHSNPQWVCQQL